MKLIFSHLNEISLNKNKVHTMMFQSTSQMYRVRKLLYDWIHGVSMTIPYLFVQDKEKDVAAKHLYVLHLDHSIFEIEQDKDFSKWLVQHLKYQLEHDELFIAEYNQFILSLEKMIYSSSLNVGEAQIEFDLTEKVIESILKQLSFHITIGDKTELNSFELRKLYIELLLKLNIHKKDVLVVYEFPENDAVSQEYKALVKYLEGLGVTVLCLTTNRSFVKYTEIENCYLIYDNGVVYDILQLRSELRLFRYEHAQLSLDELTVTLAVTDFNNETELLDRHYKAFLQSNKGAM